MSVIAHAKPRALRMRLKRSDKLCLGVSRVSHRHESGILPLRTHASAGAQRSMFFCGQTSDARPVTPPAR